jgi:signal transduction histidine kinase
VRLAEFMTINRDHILREWEEFARKISGGDLPRWILRDHAAEIVKFAAERMQSPSLPVEQRLVDAAEGKPGPVQNVAAAHVNLRIDSGFDLAQIAAEYCALRACVLRLWREHHPDNFNAGAIEITRFAEVVDENITAAVALFKERESQYRDRFLGILGHDLRNPINGVVIGAASLAQQGLDEQQLKTIGRILNSARQLSAMANDILDFARGRLGSPMPITRAAANMGVVVREVVDNVQAGNPGSVIGFESDGDPNGYWDIDRLKQMVFNLLTNAIQHGTDKKIQVTVKSDESVIVLQVHNEGPAIPKDLLATMFDPLVRGTSASQDPANLGLGLFIVKEIVSAHNGAIAVTSSEDAGTIFVVRLPRGAS